MGIVGTNIEDMNQRELLLWLGAAESKQTTSFFVTKMNSELDIAEEENTLASDIDWALQSSTLDLASGRPSSIKKQSKKQLKTSFSVGSLGYNNGGSMVIDGGHSFDNNGSKLNSSINKYGQKSRYSQARPAGLPGRTYHLHGLPCRLYNILGEPRDKPVRVQSVLKFDLKAAPNGRYAKIEAPVRRTTRNAATEILKNSLSSSLLSPANRNESISLDPNHDSLGNESSTLRSK